MRKYSFSALVAAGLLAGGLTASSASAADLGGNCCADLEERIAELEATTVRKGNRKVSLTISGWVGEQVMWWDDGDEQNVYVTGLGTTLASHFKMTGVATIFPGTYAGYVLHVELIDSDSLTINQINPIGGSALSGQFGPDDARPFTGYAVQALQSYWFLKNDQLGKVSVGLQSSPSDNAAILADGSGSLVPANWVMFDYAGFIPRTPGGGFAPGVTPIPGAANPGGGDFQTWSDVGGFCRGGGGAGGDCFGVPRDSVRYDSPTWSGFSVSAGWGGDDFWDVAARYAAEWWSFRVAAAAAYTEWTPDFYGPTTGFFNDTLNEETQYFQAGLYLQHIPTGLFAYGAYGHIETDGVTNDTDNVGGVNLAGGFAIPDGDTWYVKGGLRERWSPLGHTILYGEWAQYNDSLPDYLINSGASGAETQMWGVGIVQEIDSAAMSMWLSYRHIDGSVDCIAGAAGDDCRLLEFDNLEDFQYVKFGALVNF